MCAILFLPNFVTLSNGIILILRIFVIVLCFWKIKHFQNALACFCKVNPLDTKVLWRTSVCRRQKPFLVCGPQPRPLAWSITLNFDTQVEGHKQFISAKQKIVTLFICTFLYWEFHFKELGHLDCTAVFGGAEALNIHLWHFITNLQKIYEHLLKQSCKTCTIRIDFCKVLLYFW